MDNDQLSDIEPTIISPELPDKPRIWPVFVVPTVALTGAIVFQIAIAAIFVGRELLRGVKPEELPELVPELFAGPGAFIVLAAGGQLAFGAAAMLPAWLSKTGWKQRLGLVAPRQSWTIYPLTMLGSVVPLAIGIGAAHLLALVLPPDPSVQLLFEQMTLGWGIIFVLFIALAPGLCEELLFRGYMQRRLLERWSPWRAIATTSIIFGLVHVMPHTVLFAIPLGFWLGVIAWRTGSIGPCIACHAFVNGGVNAWRMVVKFGEVPESVQTPIVIGIFAVGVACFILVCRQLASASPESAPPNSGECHIDNV